MGGRNEKRKIGTKKLIMVNIANMMLAIHIVVNLIMVEQNCIVVKIIIVVAKERTALKTQCVPFHLTIALLVGVANANRVNKTKLHNFISNGMTIKTFTQHFDSRRNKAQLINLK